MQQEGIDEVLIDVMTVFWRSIYKTHVLAECSHAAHIEEERKGMGNWMHHTACVTKTTSPQTRGLTWFGKLGRWSSWCWGRTGGLQARQAGGASVWSETRAWWSLGRSGVPESETESRPRQKSDESQTPPHWSSTGGKGNTDMSLILNCVVKWGV